MQQFLTAGASFARCSLFIFAGLVSLGNTHTKGQNLEWPASRGGEGGGGTIGQDQYSYVKSPTFPAEDHNPDAEERKRLIVEWDKASIGYASLDRVEGRDNQFWWRWKDDDSLRPDRRIAIRGRVLIVSPDGKAQSPID